MVSSSGRTGGIAGSNKGSIPFTIANKVKSLGGCITIAYLYKLRLQGRWLNSGKNLSVRLRLINMVSAGGSITVTTEIRKILLFFNGLIG